MEATTRQPTPTGQVRRVADVLGGLVAGLMPGAVPSPEVADLWLAFDAVERLAVAGKVLLAARVDESGVWQQAGDRSAAEFLARRSGVPVTAARGQVTASRRLASLPATEAALRRGGLSGSQVDLIADAAAKNPDAEERLLGLVGRVSLAELRQECERAKAAGDPDPEGRYRRIHENRRLRQWRGKDGSWHLHAQGTADAGSQINTALEPIIDELFHAARRKGHQEPRERLAFDALHQLARRASDVDANDSETTNPDRHATDATTDANRAEPDPTDAERPGAAGGERSPNRAERRRRGKRRKNPNPKYLGLLRIDLEALVRGTVRDGEVVEIDGLGPIPVSRAHELLGESILRLVITKGHDVANITHLGRGPNTAQRIALLWTSPECTVTGCFNRRIQHDHRDPWARVHETRLDNLDELCGHHHQLKTRSGWALVEGVGKRDMVPPDDPRHPEQRRSQVPAA